MPSSGQCGLQAHMQPKVTAHINYSKGTSFGDSSDMVASIQQKGGRQSDGKPEKASITRQEEPGVMGIAADFGNLGGS